MSRLDPTQLYVKIVKEVWVPGEGADMQACFAGERKIMENLCSYPQSERASALAVLLKVVGEKWSREQVSLCLQMG